LTSYSILQLNVQADLLLEGEHNITTCFSVADLSLVIDDAVDVSSFAFRLPDRVVSWLELFFADFFCTAAVRNRLAFFLTASSQKLSTNNNTHCRPTRPEQYDRAEKQQHRQVKKKVKRERERERERERWMMM